MKITSLQPDPNTCPLCGKPNNCGNLTIVNGKKACWCSDSSIKFTEELLSKVPQELKGKACICRTCAIKHQTTALPL